MGVIVAIVAVLIGGVLAYLYFAVPSPRTEGLRHQGFLGSIREALGSAWKTVAAIWMVMVLRAIVGQSFMTFMPVLYVQKGYSIISSGLIFSMFTVAGTLSGLTAGHISDRVGFKPIFIIAHLLMSPVLYLFLHLEGDWVFLGAFLSGGCVLATMPLGVAMAQTLAPRGRSMVASLMMGFAFGLGGAVSPLVGKLADLTSIEHALALVSLLPLLTLPLIFSFPRVKAH